MTPRTTRKLATQAAKAYQKHTSCSGGVVYPPVTVWPAPPRHTPEPSSTAPDPPLAFL